jgi:probable HAF family extracellular repeat protein
MSFTSTKPNPTTGIPTLAPFLWENGKMIDLGSLGGTVTIVQGMNSRGQVTGYSNLAGDLTNHAFLWSRGKLHDLGTLGGTYSLGNSINDRGEVAGASKTANDEGYDAFLWRDGVMTDLGRVAPDCFSTGLSINSKSQVVGESFCGHQDGHAFLSENGGPAIDLNTLVSPGSGLRLFEAKFINDRGEITGAALLPSGQEHAFLLIPRDRHDDDELDDAASPSPDGAVAAGQGAKNASWGGLTAAPGAPSARAANQYSRFRFAETRSVK